MIKGIGIDSVELDRIARAFRAHGARFLDKIYTERERVSFERWRDPIPGIAGRFAAKEACMKALGTGQSRGVRLRDIEVLRSADGVPAIKLHGRAEAVFTALKATTIHCTITHSKQHAIAMVILE
jgi:holo-[acyl-carrier protein] synthase